MSPVFEMLNVSKDLGLFKIVRDITPLVSKRAWSKIIWERVWTLEDADWKASNVIFRENNLLALTVGKTRYMTWWRISDLDYSLIKMCETMAKIVCHASN